MSPEQLQDECVELLQALVRFNTVNPPGNEREAIEHLERYVAQAGFETEILTAAPERANLVADLKGEQDGPTLCFLGHVDTVLADASEWQHDPWSGDVEDGLLVGPRGARHEVAGRRRGGRRGRAGARWLASGARDAEARVRRRRGDRRRFRRPLADHQPCRQGPLRHAPQRGRRRLVPVRRPSLLRRLLRREGDLPLQHHRARHGGSRIAAADRR